MIVDKYMLGRIPRLNETFRNHHRDGLTHVSRAVDWKWKVGRNIALAAVPIREGYIWRTGKAKIMLQRTVTIG